MPGSAAAFLLADSGATDALLAAVGSGGINFAKVDEPMLTGHDLTPYASPGGVAIPVAAWLVTARAA